ncbi:MAG: putative ABC-type ATPase [Candidatus Nitrotoga sp. LAW]|nr:MAG: putative ABC-type ATPase [Candidatus Nitrotoga sp. LAW]
MEKQQLWLLAGGNGAGKSTFYRMYLEPKGMPFVNADLLARQLFPDESEARSYEAAIIAGEIRAQFLQEGRTFCFETVFSHPSKIDFIAQAKVMGYEVILVFIHLRDIALNHARIAQRVIEGGHYVPAEKVNSRIPRTLAHIQQTLSLCDYVYILDNSRADDPFQQIAVLRHGQLEIAKQPLAEWSKVILTDYLK